MIVEHRAAPLSIGLRVPHTVFSSGAGRLADYVQGAEALGLDQLCVGDHVAFRDGTGYDGLIQATAMASLTRTASIHTAVYVLPLRHPVAVARQVASLAELAPGRFVFGVGIGGDDRHEMAVCGIDPATRGLRMDESLAVVRRLLAGEHLTYLGAFYQVPGTRIAPAPDPGVPILVGGRSAAALRRAACHSEGWSGLWVSPGRFAEFIGGIESSAADAGRADVGWQHEMLVWCGFGPTPAEARASVAVPMEELYGRPFDAFERYCPTGSPEAVAEALLPYLDAGCSRLNLIANAADPERALEAVAEVGRLLRAERATRSASPVPVGS